ncbi:MAG TPA: carboxypeptidase M32 [Anaerolineaceae bacterium]|nr:carboxypeptidase M32 [Anaerolineaceae bacterium]
MQNKIEELKSRLAEIQALEAAASVLAWDQTTFMPSGSADSRGRHLAVLAQLSQEKFIAPEMGHLLDDLAPYIETLPADSDEARLIQVTRRDYEHALRIPPAWLGEYYEHATRSYQLWSEARPANDFARVIPALEKTLDYSRQLANFFPGYEHIADPLIDEADYGMKANAIRQVFDQLRTELAPMVKAITAQPEIDDSCLRRHFPNQQQINFTLDVIKQIGFDFQRGRQDISAHPFTTAFSMHDVRITTRVDEDYLGDSLFSSIHEAGHAMYEQGIDPALEGTPLATGTSSGVHESQSRLWENLIGRSHGFWVYFYPRLQQVFPEQLRDISMEVFYGAINKVQKSLVRTDADEVTYNLHVMLRFDLELALLEGALEVRHLPQAWNDRYRTDLGITPPDDRMGVLQDVHWYGGTIGGSFQGYTLGNIMSAMFFDAALAAHPEIPNQVQEGKFEILRSWLGENIYKHGRKYTANELLERVTGGSLRVGPYINYLHDKYSQLYAI